jgi:hypothetical protein
MKSRIAVAATMFSTVLIALFAVPNGRADDFYKGKTIHFVVGAPAFGSHGRCGARGHCQGNYGPTSRGYRTHQKTTGSVATFYKFDCCQETNKVTEAKLQIR